MKLPAGSTWLTHLLALLAGVGIFQGLRINASGGKAADAVAQAGPTAAKNPAEVEVIRRLTDSREKDRQSREESAREAATPEPADTRPRSQQWLEMRAKEVLIAREELAALLKRAKDYEKIADLRVPLMATLLEDGNTDAAVAIFLEWHRRDPQGAFDELALRRDWSHAVLYEDAMMMFLKPEELLAQMDARNRSTDFRETLVLELADHLVDTDDLQSLSNYYAKLDPVWAEALMFRFVSGGWLPRDGPAALAFVSNGMEESCRKALIAELADVRLDDLSREWSEGIAAPLFREALGEEKLTALRQKAEEIDRSIGGGCCGGGGEDENAGLPDQAAVAKIMQEKTPEAFDQAVGRMLLHDMDYPELFAAGKITGDGALHDMMAAIPGGKDHENEIRRAIYRQFAVWNPKAAVEWASGHLSNEDLESVTVDFERYSGTQKALQLLDFMEVLPSKFSDGKFQGGMPLALHNALEDWRVLAPEAAEAAMTRSPEVIALAERLKIEPIERSESHVLPAIEEESKDPTPAE